MPRRGILCDMPSLMLRNLPPNLVDDLKVWARLRHVSTTEAVIELLKIGLDVTSERNERIVREALDTIETVKRAGTRTSN